MIVIFNCHPSIPKIQKNQKQHLDSFTFPILTLPMCRSQFLNYRLRMRLALMAFQLKYFRPAPTTCHSLSALSYRCGSRGGGGSGPSCNFQNIHLREQHLKRYQGVYLHAHFQNFRFARLLSYLFMHVLKLPLDDFADCLVNFKDVHRSYTFCVACEV